MRLCMSAFLAFLGMFLLSLFVALLAALQLGGLLRRHRGVRAGPDRVAGFRDDLPAGVRRGQYRWRASRACSTRWRHGLALLAFIPLAFPALVKTAADRSTNPFSIGDREHRESRWSSSFPRCVAVLVQWGLVRRRWLRLRGEDDLPPVALDRDHGRRPGDPQSLRPRRRRPGASAIVRPIGCATWCAPLRLAASAALLAMAVSSKTYIRGRDAAPAAGASVQSGKAVDRFRRPTRATLNAPAQI